MRLSKKVAILQSSYIPWKGYFDIINLVDEFILYDDAQYTKRDWRNRNKIKTLNGLKWLTIPVMLKNRYYQKIKETQISDKRWGRKHWSSITHNYSKARHFEDCKEYFEELYLNCNEKSLSQVNYRFIVTICQIIGIQTKISWSMDYLIDEGKTEKLVDLCKQAGATDYISGPAARNYINEELFRQENITIHYMDYSGYPEYNQFHPPFEHGVSIIDLIFHVGPQAPKYMKSFQGGSIDSNFQ
jgi:hypothetical protein